MVSINIVLTSKHKVISSRNTSVIWHKWTSVIWQCASVKWEKQCSVTCRSSNFPPVWQNQQAQCCLAQGDSDQKCVPKQDTILLLTKYLTEQHFNKMAMNLHYYSESHIFLNLTILNWWRPIVWLFMKNTAYKEIIQNLQEMEHITCNKLKACGKRFCLNVLNSR